MINYTCSRAFLAASNKSLTSFWPFSVALSICSWALRTSSGRAIFFFCMSCNRLCIAPRESRTALAAFSKACLATCTLLSRDSFVGGGIGILSCNGLCGSGCGVRERDDEMIAELTGLTCYRKRDNVSEVRSNANTRS